jgi:hypothetical protein
LAEYNSSQSGFIGELYCGCALTYSLAFNGYDTKGIARFSRSILWGRLSRKMPGLTVCPLRVARYVARSICKFRVDKLHRSTLDDLDFLKLPIASRALAP